MLQNGVFSFAGNSRKEFTDNIEFSFSEKNKLSRKEGVCVDASTTLASLSSPTVLRTSALGSKPSKNTRLPTNEIKYSLASMIDESNQYNNWEEAEWGFPKGRRNYQEKDFECALREFSEETGYNYHHLKNIQNLMPFEEIFTGSNYKSYKHKYYLTYMDYQQSLEINTFDPTEVSKMEWKSYDDCIKSIRSYNLEKKRLITNIHNTLILFPLILGK